MRATGRFFYPLIETIILIAFISILVAHSSLLTDFSKFYSTALAHRLQTRALLNGHLALSPEPFGYKIDYFWSGHGLQQPWGLGVPLLRLPFEWIWLHLGWGPFPDRLLLFFYLIATIFVLNRSLRSIFTTAEVAPETWMGLLLRWYFIAWIVFSPAWAVLVQKQININRAYCETILYECFYIYWLMALLWKQVLKPHARTFLALSLLCGLAWLIRPTTIAYGLTAFALASACSYRNKRDLKLISAGLLCFSIGIIINLWCNYLRFGPVFEFGQSENFGGNTIFDYSMRFGFPFHKEPFVSAAKELIGAMFFNNAWQSPTMRFRWGLSGYQPPFNWVHLTIMGVGIFTCIYLWLRRGWSRLKIIFVSLVWAIMCSGLFFAFYLRTPFINSRYLVEFSPAFNVLWIALILLGLLRLKAAFRNKRVLILFLAGLGFIFYVANASFFNFNNQLPDSDGQGIIAKTEFFNTGTEGRRILNKLIENGILRDISSTQVRLDPEADLKKETVRQITEDHFNLIWNILDWTRFRQNNTQLTDKKGIEEQLAGIDRDFLLRPDLPELSYCNQSYPALGLILQYDGWGIDQGCLVSAVTSAVLPSRKCVTLNYETFAPEPRVRVKRDLTFLKSVDLKMTAEYDKKYPGREVTQVFCTDEPIVNKVAMYSIGWISPDQLTRVAYGKLPVRLNWIKVGDGR